MVAADNDALCTSAIPLPVAFKFNDDSMVARKIRELTTMAKILPVGLRDAVASGVKVTA